MSDELAAQWSIEMMMWEQRRDDAKFREYVLAWLREQLGDAIIKAVNDGWMVSSAVTTSEFDSIRHFSDADTGWLFTGPPPQENRNAWPPRRVFVMAVRMTRPTITRGPLGNPIVVLTEDDIRPPDPIYDEWSRTPWASDVWPPSEAEIHGSTR